MTSDLDAAITSQLALHRGLHTLAHPLMAMLRERLLNEKLECEVAQKPLSKELVEGLERITRWCDLAESVKPEQRAW